LPTLFDDERFSIVPETMVDGLIVIDAAGAILYFNHACERLFQYDAEEAIGQNVRILMPSDVSAAHDGYLRRHRETKVKRIIGIGRELTGMRKDGSLFPMHLSVGEGLIDGETLFVGIIYDLTDKKRGEEIILHHQKLDAIGQLSGGVAHDFNNIINIITGNLEIAADQDLTPAAQRAVARAQEAAWRAARITQRLLAFARRQPLRPKRIDVNDTLRGLAEMLRRSIGETIELVMTLSPEAWRTEADIDQFETAVLNLSLNARDAMPNGGKIAIETANIVFSETPGSVADVPPGEYVTLSVSDNGDGMSREVRERAFEPFFTTKETGAGTGLGLSMIYGFLKQLGGHARIYSEPGVGTRVTLYFPRAAEAQTGAENADKSVRMGRGETVLVVEDDADVRIVTVSRLESLGYRVLVAANGPVALETLKANTGAVDLVFTDVVMPGGMSGHDVAAAVRVIAPEVAIVLTSGYSKEMATGEGVDRAQTHFLAKPYAKKALSVVLREALDARAHRSG
jgi:PAS domain S-box-containing protein